MIVEYHRPETLQAALELLSRKSPHTVPLGGGTQLSHYQGEPIAVVDLRKLGMAKIERTGNSVIVGAAATLQDLVDADALHQAIKYTLRFEANYNLRQTATAAGTLVSGNGKSAFSSALLALDARIVLQPGGREEAVGNWLAHRGQGDKSSLITSIVIPLDVILNYECVGRSPLDIPLVSVAVAEWPTGRTRIVLGGFGPYPALVLDGADITGLESGIKDACSQLPTNENLQYILETGKILALRLLEK